MTPGKEGFPLSFTDHTMQPTEEVAPTDDTYKLIVSIRVTGKQVRNLKRHQCMMMCAATAIQSRFGGELYDATGEVDAMYDRRTGEFCIEESLRFVVTMTSAIPFYVIFDDLDEAVSMALMSGFDLQATILSVRTDLSRLIEDVARRRAV